MEIIRQSNEGTPQIRKKVFIKAFPQGQIKKDFHSLSLDHDKIFENFNKLYVVSYQVNQNQNNLVGHISTNQVKKKLKGQFEENYEKVVRQRKLQLLTQQEAQEKGDTNVFSVSPKNDLNILQNNSCFSSNASSHLTNKGNNILNIHHINNNNRLPSISLTNRPLQVIQQQQNQEGEIVLNESKIRENNSSLFTLNDHPMKNNSYCNAAKKLPVPQQYQGNQEIQQKTKRIISHLRNEKEFIEDLKGSYQFKEKENLQQANTLNLTNKTGFQNKQNLNNNTRIIIKIENEKDNNSNNKNKNKINFPNYKNNKENIDLNKPIKIQKKKEEENTNNGNKNINKHNKIIAQPQQHQRNASFDPQSTKNSLQQQQSRKVSLDRHKNIVNNGITLNQQNFNSTNINNNGGNNTKFKFMPIYMRSQINHNQ